MRTTLTFEMFTELTTTGRARPLTDTETMKERDDNRMAMKLQASQRYIDKGGVVVVVL
jgi:hypothetical protein